MIKTLLPISHVKVSLNDLYPDRFEGGTPTKISPASIIKSDAENVRFTDAIILSAQFHLKFNNNDEPKVITRVKEAFKDVPKASKKKPKAVTPVTALTV